MIRPMTTRTPSAIKTLPSGVIFPMPVGELVGEGAADVASAGAGDAGAVVTCGVGGALGGAAGRVGILGGETVTPALAAALLSAPPALLTALRPAHKDAPAQQAAAT